MLIKVNGNIARVNSRYASITADSDIILTFKVRGTCFPAKLSETSSTAASFEFRSLPYVDNTVYINYHDGTGEHAYPFKASGSNRIIRFRNLSGGTTPETIQGSLWSDANPVHFYQDLPDGVRDTVQDAYPYYRDVSIRFARPQSIANVTIDYTRVFGVFPSAVSKLRNLEVLFARQLVDVETFAQDFYNSSIRDLTLQRVGAVMESGFPLWVLNSNFLRLLNLSNSINLSGSPVEKRFSQINRLKDVLEVLNLGGVDIDYRFPESFNELYKLNQLILSGCSHVNMRFPEDISGLTGLTDLDLRATRMPFAEIERIISNTNLNWLDIGACTYNTDYDIPEENHTIEWISIGGQTWGNGVPPTFVSKLKGLKELFITTNNVSNQYSGLTGFGDLSACTNLESIYIHRLPNFQPTIPEWFSDLTKLKVFNVAATFNNTGLIDAFINNFYEFIISNASLDNGAGQFRQMSINAYGTNSSDQNNSQRPIGTYQKPAGYVQGVSNGEPATPMEKIWVLTQQYEHMWTIKPV